MADPQSGLEGADHPDLSGAKLALRDQVMTTRNRRSLVGRSEVAHAVAAHLVATTEVRRAATVAAYVGVTAAATPSGITRFVDPSLTF